MTTQQATTSNASPWNARLSVPESAAAGEVVEIKTLVNHPMETGYRRDRVGEVIARNILVEFSCRYRGREVFRAELTPGIAANPYLSFFLRIPADDEASGELEFRWRDQHGVEMTQARTIRVE